MGGVTAGGDTVLIVGAGPVGLVLACELRQQGLEVRLVDAERGHTRHSRANVIWPRNLELLERVGVTRPLLAAGHRISGTAFHSAGRRIGTAYLSRMRDTSHPYAVMIAQHRTEEILQDRLTALGGSVERGVRLTALDAGGDRPAVELTHPDGRTEHLAPDWLVGADGAHSTVRSALGVGYAGDTVDVTFAITDAVMTTTLSDELSHYCYSPRGAMAVGPMGGGVFRLAVNVPHGRYDDAPPPSELFRTLVAERGAGRSTVGELLWSGTFRVRCAVAETFRSGRCFLAGDAAHIVSPAGGQGMNTGMQDAFNLAWKLAGVVRGRLGEAVLDSYDRERRHVSHQVARNTALLTRAGVATTPVRAAVRDGVFRAAHATGLLQRHLAPQLSQTDIGYGAAAGPGTGAHAGARTGAGRGRGPAALGARLPVRASSEPGISRDGAWPVVCRDRHSVLLWPGRGRAAAGATTRAALTRTAAALPDDVPALVLDHRVTSALARALGDRPAAAVVRPDGHLAARVDDLRPEAVLAAVRAAQARRNVRPSAPAGAPGGQGAR